MKRMRPRNLRRRMNKAFTNAELRRMEQDGEDIRPFALANDAPKRAAQRPENDPTRQTVLFSGMDCLPDQQDLFQTDGQA